MAATRIIIVGGGVAGIQLATSLGRALGRPGTAQVTLVDRSLSHVWKPMLHTFAAGTAHPDRQKVDFLAQAKANAFGFRPGEFLAADVAARRIRMRPFADPGGAGADGPAAEAGYDVLVMAVGSRANDFGIPGVAEHCMTIEDLADAEAFHGRLRHHILASLHDERALDIAIVGGGATGVELAAELKQAIDLLAGYGSPDLPRRLRLALIESGPRILPAFPERVSRAAMETLESLDVDVRTGTMVEGADATGFRLKGDGRIEAGLKVWAAGVRAPEALGAIAGLERSRTGQLVVRPSLQATRDDTVFALGDCASLTDPDTGRPVPATAQAARQQAMHLAASLPAWLRGKPAAPFRYREKGAIVSLADYNGWGTLGRYTFGGGRWHGLSARLAHDLLYRQHQLGLFGPGRAALAWLADDLTQLVSPPVRLD